MRRTDTGGYEATGERGLEVGIGARLDWEVIVGAEREFVFAPPPAGRGCWFFSGGLFVCFYVSLVPVKMFEYYDMSRQTIETP